MNDNTLRQSQSGVNSGESRVEDDTFGWRMFHDRQRNLVYYLHSYTGEVRWPRPETVGFVMHGLKPLPANAEAGIDAGLMNPDIWNPYYPHVVMLPSGLMQVHPNRGTETQEMWCGYNRFPLANSKTLSVQHKAPGLHGPRILPPTWEDSRSGSPFLPPYPVAVLGRDNTNESHPPAPKFHDEPSPLDLPPSSHHLQHGEVGRVQGALNWPSCTHPTTASNVSVVERKQPVVADPKGFVASNMLEKKEHNRKGYLLRQARKMMRDGSYNANITTASTIPKKPRKIQETPLTTKTRNGCEQEKLTRHQDLDPIRPLHC